MFFFFSHERYFPDDGKIKDSFRFTLGKYDYKECLLTDMTVSYLFKKILLEDFITGNQQYWLNNERCIPFKTRIKIHFTIVFVVLASSCGKQKKFITNHHTSNSQEKLQQKLELFMEKGEMIFNSSHLLLTY